MKNTIKNPCDQCPFRQNSFPGWLGPSTSQETYHYVMNEGDFSCHKTRNKPPQNQSRCRGSLLFLKQACKSPKYNKPLDEALRQIPFQLQFPNILQVHKFLEHHEQFNPS